jgi:peptidoglycan/xylan/chitin deacetylase (PgdA/CDA1 family)
MRHNGFARALLGWLMVFPSVVRNSSWFAPVETRFAACGRQLRLTIDDGPDPRQTPQILDLLAREGVRAEFFVIGKKAAAHPELCRRMCAEGHLVQNHTFSHPSASFWAAGPSRARSEIAGCSAAIRETTGCEPARFRAPVGMANPFVHLAARDLGLKMSGWSASGNDGVPHDPARVISKITTSLQPGAVVLLHDSHLLGMREGQRACTLEALLASVRDHGFSFVLDPA